MLNMMVCDVIKRSSRRSRVSPGSVTSRCNDMIEDGKIPALRPTVNMSNLKPQFSFFLPRSSRNKEKSGAWKYRTQTVSATNHRKTPAANWLFSATIPRHQPSRSESLRFILNGSLH